MRNMKVTESETEQRSFFLQTYETEISHMKAVIQIK